MVAIHIDTHGDRTSFLTTKSFVIVGAQTQLKVRRTEIQQGLTKNSGVGAAGFVKVGGAVYFIHQEFTAQDVLMAADADLVLPTGTAGFGVEGAVTKFVPCILLINGFGQQDTAPPIVADGRVQTNTNGLDSKICITALELGIALGTHEDNAGFPTGVELVSNGRQG